MIHTWYFPTVGTLKFDDEAKTLQLAELPPVVATDLFNDKYKDDGHFLWKADVTMKASGDQKIDRWFKLGCTETSYGCADPSVQEEVYHYCAGR